MASKAALPAQPGTIVILDEDRNRAEQLKQLLRFLGWQEVIAIQPTRERQRLALLPRPGAVFVEGSACTASLTDEIQALGWEDSLLVLIGAISEWHSLPAALAAHRIPRLDWPLRYSQLRQVLDQLQQRVPALAHPSLSDRRPQLFRSLTGTSAAIEQIRSLIERVALSQTTVLITGESGTGKEVVARNLHYFSARRSGPFVPVNCGAIPPNLLESELFGHEKGAFTGALTSRKGRFELAAGGTLFLDEIGDMPQDMQVKLLRVLQERTFERIGGDRTIAADVRLIAATHRNLEALVEKGRFREDLYYRLSVFPIELPALRERLEDLPLLLADLNARLRHEQNLEVDLTPAALACLQGYGWPGNVRELANLMERLVILFPDQRVDVEQLPHRFRAHRPAVAPPPAPAPAPAPAPLQSPQRIPIPRPPGRNRPAHLPPQGLDLRQYLEDEERRLIQAALRESGGVVARAAQRLGLRRTTLVEKMRRYGSPPGPD